MDTEANSQEGKTGNLEEGGLGGRVHEGRKVHDFDNDLSWW